MRLTRTHLTLVLAVLLVLGGAAAGFFIGTSSQPAQAADTTAAAGQIDPQDFDAAVAAAGFALDPSAATTVASNASGPAARVSAILGLRTGLARLARTLIHAQATLDLPNRGVQTYALDQGKVGPVSATSLTITETGGATVSFTLTSATRVRSKGAAATLAAVTTGADVIVVSQQTSGGWTGLAIVIVPPAAVPAASPAPTD
ncbi:MAG TPA: hypothetical protein VN771_06455 [Candidatus Baltobacteraceae bacterium]|nr:hypothetical protein [Candidatus Baltobacteraceae bacterium]